MQNRSPLPFEIPAAVLTIVCLAWLAGGVKYSHLAVWGLLMLIAAVLGVVGTKIRKSDQAKATSDVIDEIRRSRHDGKP